MIRALAVLAVLMACSGVVVEVQAIRHPEHAPGLFAVGRRLVGYGLAVLALAWILAPWPW